MYLELATFNGDCPDLKPPSGSFCDHSVFALSEMWL